MLAHSLNDQNNTGLESRVPSEMFLLAVRENDKF